MPSQGLHSVIAGLLATDSIDRRLADHVDRDAQKALRYWERGDEERAEKELRGVLDELDQTQDDMAESAIRELHDRIVRIARTMGFDELSQDDDNGPDE